MKVIFNNEELTLRWGKYQNGNTALHILFERSMDCPYVTASTNADEILEEGYILINDYCEIMGVMDALVEAGIVEDRPERDTIILTKLLVTPS